MQCAHAAFAFACSHPEVTSEWLRDSSYLVLVAVPHEDALLDLLDEAFKGGIRHAYVCEPDMNDEHTAVALEPTPLAQKLCANLPLILKEPAMA